jgi:hypothetical protein
MRDSLHGLLDYRDLLLSQPVELVDQMIDLLAPITAGEERINEAADTLAGVRTRLSRAARFLINPGLIPILKQRAVEAAPAA